MSNSNPNSHPPPTPLAVLLVNDYRVDMLVKRVPEVLKIPVAERRPLVAGAIRHPLVVSLVAVAGLVCLGLGMWVIAPIIFTLQSYGGRSAATLAGVVGIPVMIGVLVAIVPLATYLQVRVLRKMANQRLMSGVGEDYEGIVARGNTALIMVGLAVLVLAAVVFAGYLVMD